VTFEIDWQYIKNNLIILLITTALSLTIALVSTLYHSSYHSDFVKLDQQVKQLYMNIKAAKDEASLIRTYHPQFKTLIEKGLIEKEHRLKWVSAFQLKTNSMKLRIAKYQITPQRKIDHPILGNTAVELYSSKMKISVHLLHEYDLLKLLTIFDSTPGIYHLSSCKLSQPNATISFVKGVSNFIANCELDWYTLKPQRLVNSREAL